MCGCFVLGLGAFFPRVAILLVWLFTNPSWVTRAFNGEWLLPLLGVILLPYTTLAYILLYQLQDGRVTGFSWFLVALAFVIDLGAWFGGARGGANYRQTGQAA